MRFSIYLAALVSLKGTVRGVLANIESRSGASPRHGHHAHSKRLLFDPLTTPIQVTGEHGFIAPDFDAGDQRGPCPGLNALANHGYISRNGVAGLLEVTTAINSVYGMGIDISTLLATLGTVFVGNPLSLNPGFSIGGSSPGVESLLDTGLTSGLLGTPRGLIGSHNIIESDSSPTRSDLYIGGDASTMDLAQFKAIYDEFPSEGSPAFEILARRAAIKFNESISTNPNFYYGPFTGSIARNAGYFFIARLLSNYSVDTATEGLMTKEIFKSFFAVEGEGENMTYTKGHERIPENWYRSPVDYDIVRFNLDFLRLITIYPELASIGGNTGSVNSFVGVDLADVTGGVLGSTNLLESNNLLCFAFQVVKTAAPNILSSIFSTVAGPLGLLTDALGLDTLNLTCPAFGDLTMGGKPLLDGLEDKFPGAKKAGNVL